MFDIGGHSFHTPHAEVRAFVETLMAGNWDAQKRDARVWFNGDIIPYPFQTNYQHLRDARVIEACNAAPGGDASHATNFEEWVYARFGKGVAEAFMLPYNRKLWARDLKKISCEWVGERVAAPTTKHNAEMKDGKRAPLVPDSRVAYPARGGFVEIFKTMARDCGPIAHGSEIAQVDTRLKTVTAKDGRSWRYDHLVSTMPAPLLLRAINHAPAELLARAAQLEQLQLRVVMVVVADPLRDAPQRIYVSDPTIPPHKVAFNHTSSQALRGRPVHAIMCEIAHSADKPLPSDTQLEATLTDWLVDSKLVPSRASIARIVHHETPYGYPVYTHERPAIMHDIRTYLGAHDIHTIGRFGAWDYANSDECMRQGIELAHALNAAHTI